MSVADPGAGPLRIWVDADACPAVIKDILYRAAERAQVTLTLVANKPLRVPRSPYIRTLQVPRGFDVADAKIAAEVAAGDLVITADIPLAAAVLERGGHALDPRGAPYSADTIKGRLAMRSFMDELRGSGVDTGGPASFSQADRKAFAGALERFLLKHSSAPG